HRHPTEVGVRGPGREVERARAQRRQTHSGPTGQTPVGGGHERGGLLVASEDELDRRLAHGIEEIDVLLAGNAEDALDALVLRGSDHDIGCTLCRHVPDTTAHSTQDICPRPHRGGPTRPAAPTWSSHPHPPRRASLTQVAEAAEFIPRTPPRRRPPETIDWRR